MLLGCQGLRRQKHFARTRYQGGYAVSGLCRWARCRSRGSARASARLTVPDAAKPRTKSVVFASIRQFVQARIVGTHPWVLVKKRVLYRYRKRPYIVIPA